jgi:hypothetical protein
VSSRLVVTGGRFHRYSLDGVIVPSVTGITGKIDKPGLAGAAAREVAHWAATHAGELDAQGEAEWIDSAKGSYQRVWNRSRDNGTAVHAIAQQLIFGEPVETTDPDTGVPYSDDVVRMGAQVAQFMDLWHVSPDTALVEQPVFHDELRYAGRFDLCGVLRGGDRWLIDYKTSASGVYPESALQLTAYSRATHVQIGDRDMLMPPVSRCAVLWVRPDFWELVPVKSDDATWAAFTHLLAVTGWLSQKRDDVVGGALPVPVGA